jgi:hypothetical protein
MLFPEELFPWQFTNINLVQPIEIFPYLAFLVYEIKIMNVRDM